MLAFSNDYYGFIFRATQSVELFCAYNGEEYEYSNPADKIWVLPDEVDSYCEENGIELE